MIHKKILIKFEKLEYLWHNKKWTSTHNNLVVSTSLSQKLTQFAIENNILKFEDLNK